METLVIILYVITFSLLMGFISRVIGAPKGAIIEESLNPFKDILYALPYAFLAVLPFKGYEEPLWVILGTLLGAFGIALYGKRMSHGSGIDMGTFGGTYWGDFLLLTWTGIVVTLGTFMSLLLTGYPLVALGVLLGGSLKGVAYAQGWFLEGFLKGQPFGEHLDEPTEMGEFLTGVYAGVPLAIGIISLTA